MILVFEKFTKFGAGMILFVENNMPGERHKAINQALVKVFSEVFNGEGAGIACSESHYRLCLQDSNDINFRLTLKVFDPTEKAKKYFYELVSFFRIFRLLKKEKFRKIVFLSLSPVSHFFLRVLAFIGIINIDVFVIFHGELSFLAQNSRNPLRPGFWMKRAFNIRNGKAKVEYIVLSEHIRIPSVLDESCIIKINHPVIFSNDFVFSKGPEEYPLNVGLLGSASLRKGSDRFFKISDVFRNDPDFRFYVSGSIDPVFRTYSNVIGDFSGEFVQSSNVEETLNKIDCSIFIYDSSYDLVASGALLDAIKYCIPVLCLRNQLFDFLYDRGLRFFKIFDSEDDLISYLKCTDFNEIIEMKATFRDAQNFFSIESSVKKLRESQNLT